MNVRRLTYALITALRFQGPPSFLNSSKLFTRICSRSFVRWSGFDLRRKFWISKKIVNLQHCRRFLLSNRFVWIHRTKIECLWGADSCFYIIRIACQLDGNFSFRASEKFENRQRRANKNQEIERWLLWRGG